MFTSLWSFLLLSSLNTSATANPLPFNIVRDIFETKCDVILQMLIQATNNDTERKVKTQTSPILWQKVKKNQRIVFNSWPKIKIRFALWLSFNHIYTINYFVFTGFTQNEVRNNFEAVPIERASSISYSSYVQASFIIVTHDPTLINPKCKDVVVVQEGLSLGKHFKPRRKMTAAITNRLLWWPFLPFWL